MWSRRAARIGPHVWPFPFSLLEWIGKKLVASDTRLISQTDDPVVHPGELVVLSVVRNGEEQLDSFLKHHFALGAKHVVLLDNGSGDRTIEIASRFGGVTVLRSELPFRYFKHLFRRYLCERFGGSGWQLFLDIDERFDFPLSDRIPLVDFLAYLRSEGYTAVVAQLLDLFPDGPVDTWPNARANPASFARFFDHSSLIRRKLDTSFDYEERRNRCSSSDIELLVGGVRKLVFGIDCYLTKHPLLFKAGGARPSLDSSHVCERARIADTSCVLYHYKFTGGFRDRIERGYQWKSYWKSSAEYGAYVDALDRSPEICLKRETAQMYSTIDSLIDSGFLVVSKRYRRWVEERSENRI